MSLVFMTAFLCPPARAQASREGEGLAGYTRCTEDKDCLGLGQSVKCQTQKYACGPASTCGARVCVTAPPPVQLEIVDIDHLQRLPLTRQPVCSVDVKTDDDRIFVERLWTLYAGSFEFKDWRSFGPDSGYRRITLAWAGKKIVLESWHPLIERGGKGVAMSYGVAALNGRTVKDALKNDDALYRKRRTSFDILVLECEKRIKNR